jgi:hypothetical protein
MDYTNRHIWKHPRTTRDAFGEEFEPLRKNLTFLPDTRSLLILDVVIAILLVVFAWSVL